MKAPTLVGDCRKYYEGIKIQTRGIRVTLEAAIVKLQTLPLVVDEPDKVLHE